MVKWKRKRGLFRFFGDIHQIVKRNEVLSWLHEDGSVGIAGHYCNIVCVMAHCVRGLSKVPEKQVAHYGDLT